MSEPIIAFTANFVGMMADAKIERKHARALAEMAVSVLVGAVLHLAPDDAHVEEVKTLIAVTIKASLDHFYGKEVSK